MLPTLTISNISWILANSLQIAILAQGQKLSICRKLLKLNFYYVGNTDIVILGWDDDDDDVFAKPFV